MLRFLPLLFALFAVLIPIFPCAAQSPSPTAAGKLRRLLPLPEATLRRKMQLDIGIDYVPNGKSELLRPSSDYAARIVQVRRTLTGGPADAPRYLALGYLYRSAGLLGKSNAAFQQSELLCRNALRQQPDNGFALAEYGHTLQASGHPAEAEAYLRRAASLAPKSADVWRALGTVLAEQVSPQAEATKHFAREAATAYDRAVLLAPHDPAVWAARGNFRDWVLPSLHGKLLSRDGLGDYEWVAALAPTDPYAQAMVPTLDYGFVEVTDNLPTSPEAAGMETSEADRLAKAALRRITAIAQSTRGQKSASAYAARAWVQFQFCYDPHGAQKSLRLALQQNPRQQDAIDYQMHVAAVTGDYPLLAATCRRELRRRSEVRLRVLLAYADYYLAQQKPRYRQEGLAQMELAHAAQPHDYACTLGLATFLLAAGKVPRANLLLTEIAAKAAAHPKEQQAEYDVTRGVGEALAGRPEEAQTFFVMALKNDPKNQAAKSAPALLPR